MRNIFGWSYPPGCSGPPEYDEQCEVCGLEVDTCICPECKCGETGNPDCYENHGLEMSDAQRESLARIEALEEADAKAESDYYEQFSEEV